MVHLYGSAVPLRDPSGAPRGAIGAFVDVTRLKQAEAALRDADRRKDEFLALLSHELRNPLAPILTAAQLMQLRGDVATPREREVILRQAQHLVRLVDDLLDVSRVARGKVTLAKKPLELASVVAKAVEATATLLEQRRHQLQLSVPTEGLPIEADEVRLTQVVSNLLTNAARYTPPGGRIEVTAAREGDEVVLRGSRQRRGHRRRLCCRTCSTCSCKARAAPTAPRAGSGSGCRLVRTLTTLHGGTVSAHSDGLGRGSEFTVRLPASTPPANLDAARRPAPHCGSGDGARVQRVLVVDDNRDGAEMISSLLTHAGHEVQIANDPSQALSLADTFRPQVAILDIGLAGDGRLHAGARAARAPGRRRAGPDRAHGLRPGTGQAPQRGSGVRLHLVKPVDAEPLVKLLDALVERSQ